MSSIPSLFTSPIKLTECPNRLCEVAVGVIRKPFSPFNTLGSKIGSYCAKAAKIVNSSNEEIGTIDNSPDPHAPSGQNSLAVPKIGKRDWLVIGVDEQPFGKGVKATTKWRLSGRRKWNQDIYD